MSTGERIISISDRLEGITLYDNSRYHLIETKHTLRLVEEFIGEELVVGRVHGWKTGLLLKVNQQLKNCDGRERGYRLVLALKVLNSLRTSRSTTAYLHVMSALSLEEVVFWVWQFNSYGKKVAAAFKHIHLSNR